MTEEEQKFLSENIALESSSALAEYATALFGPKAAPLLMGAALKVLERDGEEFTFDVVERWLTVIIAAKNGPSAYN